MLKTSRNRLLITGAGGYIASVAIYELLKHGYTIVAIDNFSNGYRQPLEVLKQKFSGQITIHNIDINTKKFIHFLTILEDISTVIHFAGSCNVDESTKNPSKYYLNNFLGTENLLKGMVNSGINKIIFSSTCAVYGEAEYLPIDEKHSTMPTNPYGFSKLFAENIIHWYGKNYGIKYIILRYFNVCGASEDGLIGDSKKPSSLLVQNAVRGALGIEPFYLTCPKVNTQDGTPIRDYIDVVDLAEAHIKAYDVLIKRKVSTVLNLGTGKGSSVLDIMRIVEKETSNELSFEVHTARRGEYSKMIADVSKAKKILDWKPRRNMQDSILSLVKWYKYKPYGWKY